MSNDTLPISANLEDAVQALEAGNKKTIVILAENGTLFGTITDGDIRRCLLTTRTLDAPVSLGANQTPILAAQ